MPQRDQLQKSFQKANKERKRRGFHSKAYHRFFEGYTEISVPDSIDGKYKIERIYTDNYYRQNLSKGKQILLRIGYFIVIIVVVFLFVVSAASQIMSNTVWYVNLPQAFCVPCLGWLAIAFAKYLPVGRDLTIYEYKTSSKALHKATFVSAICFGFISIAVLCFVLMNQVSTLKAELIAAGSYLGAALLVLGIHWVESKIEYLLISSTNKISDNAQDDDEGID